MSKERLMILQKGRFFIHNLIDLTSIFYSPEGKLPQETFGLKDFRSVSRFKKIYYAVNS